jgi:hypothetical protein
MTDMICEEKINSYNMIISQLMKELGYYTEEEYNINTELNKRHYDDIMDSNSIITTHMKTLSTIKTSLKIHTNLSDMYSFLDVMRTLQEWIDEQNEYLSEAKYPFQDIIGISYELYCEKKEIDIMNNPELAPLLQKIKEIKNILSNLYEMRTIECEI